MASIFDEELERQRKQLDEVGVNQAMVDAAGLLPVASEPPKHWLEQARERDGNAKFFGKMLLGGFTGTMPFMFPEGIGGNARYKAQLGQYYDAQQKLAEQQQMQKDIKVLGDGIEDERDVEARVRLLGTEGLGTIDKVEYALTGDRPGVKPEYVTVTNNGQVFMVDKNNPTAPGIPMTTPDGQPIRNKLDQWQVDNIGAFDRMAPRLQQLDRLEQDGMAIPRSVMTQLRAYETRDADGNNVLLASAFGEWMSRYLTPEQRQYILAAEDAGMIVLRDESGAAISSGEILRQMNQYLMFDDLDANTMREQRLARNRKAQSLMTGMPDYITSERAPTLKWLEEFDGSLNRAGADPKLTTGGGKLPPMTSEDMTTYLQLMEIDKAKANRFLELLSGEAGGNQ